MINKINKEWRRSMNAVQGHYISVIGENEYIGQQISNMTFEKKFEVLQVKIEIFIQKDAVIYETTGTFY
jgi:hypothetical protein